MRAAYPDTDLLVFGHSHIPWDTSHEGLRLLNPGSPTDRRREPHCTYLTLRLAGGAVEDVVLHRLRHAAEAGPRVGPGVGAGVSGRCAGRQAGASAKRR